MGAKGDGKGGRKGKGKPKGSKSDAYIRNGYIERPKPNKTTKKEDVAQEEESVDDEKPKSKKRKRSRQKKEKKDDGNRENKNQDSGDHRRREKPVEKPIPEETEFAIDYMSHYPGLAAVFPSISLMLAALSESFISVLSAGKRSDKAKVSPFPLLLLTSSFFTVTLMSNAAKYSASRVIGIDRMYETGESVLPKLQPLFKFVHSTNLTTFFSHLLGQFRTPDQVLVTPLARPFLASPIRDESSADMEVNWDDSDEVDDLMDIAQFHDDGPLFCGLRMRWCHDPSQILFLWSCYLDNLDFNAALTLLNRVFLGVAASPFFLSWEGYRSSYDHPLSAEQEEAIRKVFPVICPFDVCWRTYYVKKLRLDTYFNLGIYACPMFRELSDILLNSDASNHGVRQQFYEKTNIPHLTVGVKLKISSHSCLRTQLLICHLLKLNFGEGRTPKFLNAQLEDHADFL